MPNWAQIAPVLDVFDGIPPSILAFSLPLSALG